MSRASSMGGVSNNPFFASGGDGDDTAMPTKATLEDAAVSLDEPTLAALSQVLNQREQSMSQADLALVLAAFDVTASHGSRASMSGVAKKIREVLRDGAKACNSWGKAVAQFTAGEKDMATVLKLGSPLKVLVFSWNVGNKMPDEAELALWCPEGGGDFDLIVVGTQENKYKKKNTASPVEEVDDAEDSHDEDEHEHEHAEIEEHEQAEHEKYDHEKYDHKATQKGHNHWDQIVSKRLGTEWGVVKSSVLWQMRLTVFAPLRHLAGDLARISHVEMRKSRTGIGGVVANKGGLVCRLDFAGTTLCFISSHLAAHSHKLKQRNDNCQEILRETARLAHNHLDAASHFDHVFWLGDLNYRVDLNAKAKEAGRPEKSFDAQMDEVQACINRGDFATLWEWDQLKMAQADGEAFVKFIEGPLDFKPTFKVMRHAGSEYKHNRIPSYCDRVLWKSMPQRINAVKQTLFTGLEATRTSDHKPVVAHFEIASSPVVKTVAPKQLSGAPLLQFRALKATGVRAADMNGKSDPFVVFFSNPPGLFGSRPPMTKVKKETRNAEWTPLEIPVLRPLVESPTELAECALIMVLYDSDLVGHDDPLGRVIIKLGPQDGDAVDLATATSYTVNFESPIIWGNKSAGMGVLKGEFVVALGDDLSKAIGQVKQEKIGSKAKRKQKAPSSCSIL